MKKWFKRNGVELVFGIGISLFLINFFTSQEGYLYVISIPLVVFGMMRLYQRHFGPRYYSLGDSFFASIDDGDDDDMYEEAKAAVIDARKASTSYIQRKLRVGYSRAARLIDLLEERGVIGPHQDDAKPREVLMKHDDENIS